MLEDIYPHSMQRRFKMPDPEILDTQEDDEPLPDIPNDDVGE